MTGSLNSVNVKCSPGTSVTAFQAHRRHGNRENREVRVQVSRDMSHGHKPHFPVHMGPQSMIDFFLKSTRPLLMAAYQALESMNEGVGAEWRSDNFAPVGKEIHAENLHVEGEVPEELEGWYMRTGPNPQFPANGGYHWYDGEAMVHSILFGGRKAKAYSNHWVRCPMLVEERKAGRNIFLRLGDAKGIRGLLMLALKEAMRLEPNAPELQTYAMGNTSIVYHAGRVLALHETSAPFELGLQPPGTLESLGGVTFGGKLTHEFSAHPKVDPETGVLHNFGYNLRGKPYLRYFTVSPSGEMSEPVAIDLRGPTLIHDFGLSKNFAVFLEHNMVFKPENMVLKNSSPLTTDTNQPGRIGLLRLQAPTEPVQWFEVEPFIFFHVAHAWDDGDVTHVVVSEFDEVEGLDLMEGAEKRAKSQQILTRYSLNTKTGVATRTVLCPELSMDFSLLAPQLVGRRARYCWAAEWGKGIMGRGVVKADMQAAEGQGFVARIEHPVGTKGGEMLFVPRDAAATARGNAEEDDGFLVGYVNDNDTMTSYCVVYDAKTMSDIPLAKIKLPQRVPWGFHGTFVHSSQLARKQLA